MSQEIDEDQDVGERQEGEWVGERLQSSWFEADDECTKNKAHSVIWVSAHTQNIYFKLCPRTPMPPTIPYTLFLSPWNREDSRLGNQADLRFILTWSLTGYVTLGKSHDFSEPQFPHLLPGDNYQKAGVRTE